jgi:hypothetical protein
MMPPSNRIALPETTSKAHEKHMSEESVLKNNFDTKGKATCNQFTPVQSPWFLLQPLSISSATPPVIYMLEDQVD